jgi:flagellar biosynthesis protein FlhG
MLDSEEGSSTLVKGFALAVASGKGGVGKSTIVVNLAVTLARLGRKVLALDADFSLANLDVLMGLRPRRTILHFLRGECRLEDLIVEGPAGIHLIPAASGIVDLARMGARMRRALLLGLEPIRRRYDCLLIDAPAGIGQNVLALCRAADRVVVVVAPEPASLINAYATIKVLVRTGDLARLSLLVNGAADELEGRAIHGQIDRVCRRFLGDGIVFAGAILKDSRVADAVRAQRAVVESYPHCPASLGYQRLATRIARTEGPFPSARPLFRHDLPAPRDEAPF